MVRWNNFDNIRSTKPHYWLSNSVLPSTFKVFYQTILSLVSFLYRSYDTSNSEFIVNTKILQNETLSQNPALSQSDFVVWTLSLSFLLKISKKNKSSKKIGNRGKSGHSMMHTFDDKTSVIFFSMLTRNAITCWNSNKKYLEENQGSIIENDDRFKYPTDLNVRKRITIQLQTSSILIQQNA